MNSKKIGDVGVRNTGTSITFKPNPEYFEDINVQVKTLKTLIKGKSSFCPGLTIEFINEKKPNDKEKWYFEDGLKSYLNESSEGSELILEDSIICSKEGSAQGTRVCYKLVTSKPPKNKLDETYVNLIPTAQGGSHLNGFKSGLLRVYKRIL